MTLLEILETMENQPSYYEGVEFAFRALREHANWTEQDCIKHTYIEMDLWDDSETVDYKGTYRAIKASIKETLQIA